MLSLTHLIQRISWLPYRVMRRYATANVCCFFAAEFGDLSTPHLPEGMAFTELTPTKLGALSDEYPELFSSEQAGFLEQSQARGFVVLDDGKLASFLWLAVEDIPGSMNHDGHTSSQLPLFLPDRMVYLFRVFVLPKYRGRRLYGAMVSELSSQLRAEGFTRIMLATDGSNYRALRSVRRIGFQLIGLAVRHR